MEDLSSRAASPSCDGDVLVEANGATTEISLEDRTLDLTTRTSLSLVRTPQTKKAKLVRFFRNGDKFYTGVVMAVTPERYRSFDSLASDLTRALISSVTLPNGVRSIYTMDGRKVQTIGDLEDGKFYVVSGQGEPFKKVEYSAAKVRRGSSLSGLPQSPAGTGKQISSIPGCVKAKIVTLIRNGSKPRRVLRLLLNKRNAPSLEHVFEAITEAVKLDSGAVRRVYTMAGKPVISLEQFFGSEEVFIAYGVEKSTQEDFELDSEESKNVQSFRRGPWASKRQSGPMPVMPRKSGKRTLTAPQVRTPSPSSLILPQPLRLHYAVGHVIGDGNFAVVRHCIHKTTGAEYAMKIVDKYKCQGKETMLASEVAILRQVCHPNIISLIGEQETVDQLFLVMELVKGGDLFDAITAATKFSEAEASVMIGHLTSALAYLHSHYIVHRDVKPENLLVEMEGSQVRCLKLGDFGLAQVVREPLYTVCGTPTYVAPEILAESGYGLKIDVWAAGVILYILLCGFPPFVSPENDQEELFERILSGQYEFTAPYWEPISDSAKQLISNMLQTQPELRFSAEDVLDHPWLVQRFLGGDASASGSRATGQSSQQHRNQQCQPLRLATFEFDYKKQRRHDVAVACDRTATRGVGDSNTIDATGTDVTSQLDAPAPVTEADPRENATVDPQLIANDEIDNLNGNRPVEDEPLSLSADCLQDIRDFTSSLQDLVNNIDAKPEVFSTSSIPEKYRSARPTNGKILPRRTEESSPTSRLNHSAIARNGNSLTDIRSACSPVHCGDNGKKRNANQPETPRTAQIAIDRILRPKKRNLSKASAFTRNGSNDRHSSVERLSQSTDGLSGSSDNNIETSDSFVNIQFAKESRGGHESSSTQSIESSDSFENTRFVRDTDPHDNGHEEPRHDGTPAPTSSRRYSENSEKRSIGLPKGRTKPSTESNGSKTSRPSMIPVQSNGSQRTSVKSTESPKLPQNDQTVKLRDKKNLTASNAQTRSNETRSKRFSYFSPYSSRIPETRNDCVVKIGRDSMGNGRKCSSTDELREERQKPSTPKAKRFSLYYTPQPSRKTYETETKSPRTASKTSANSVNPSGQRPNSWKIPETTRRIGEEGGSERKDTTRNRRSVAECSTAASRNKANRQAVHIRGTATSTNTNLGPGRTK